MPRIYKRNCDNCKIYYKNQNDKFCSRKCSSSFLPKRIAMSERNKLNGIIPPSRKGIKFTAEQKKKRGELISYQYKVGIRKANPEVTKNLIANRGSGSLGKTWELADDIRKRYSQIVRKRFENIIKVTPLKEMIRKCVEYRFWRERIFKRDDYTCQECNERGKKLNADHYPNSFSYLIRTNKIRTLEEALNCKELWNIDNGRTLCVDCHKNTDNYLVNKGGNIVKELQFT